MPRLREFRWQRWADARYAEWQSDKPDIIAYDCETEGVGFYDRAFASTLTWRRLDGSLRSAYLDLEADGFERRIEMLREMLVGTGRVVCHNLKFDAAKALLMGALTWDDLEALELHDTQTLYTLVDENGRKGLKHLAVAVLGIEDVVEVEIKSGPNKGQHKRVPREQHVLNTVRRKLKLKKEDGYHLLPREVIAPYALKDTELTLRLYEILRPRLESVGDPRLLEIYAERMELKRALLRMESDGFALDMPYLNATTSEYGAKVMEGWGDIVALTGSPEFNPGSPAQILEAFARRGVRLDNTQEHMLKELDDELARTLLQYRSDKKIHTTYLTALQHEQRDGIVHPNFNDDAARTGRMSSSAASNN